MGRGIYQHNAKLKRLRITPEANENHSYGVIGKVLTAYILGVTT
jgi:hypothetical protein